MVRAAAVGRRSRAVRRLGWLPGCGACAQVRAAGVEGSIAGIVWSLGNVFSMYAVLSLGEVGYLTYLT